jgi:amidohydrolase
MFKRVSYGFSLLALLTGANVLAQAPAIEPLADAVADEVLAWRRDIHQFPELGNREFETSRKVAEHLRALGIETRTGIAHTGVVGLLKGGKPGPRIALRADMDALPVTEATGLSFASTVRTTYRGQDVGVMHACGHDAHVALLMAAAEVLVGMKSELAGEVTREWYSRYQAERRAIDAEAAANEAEELAEERSDDDNDRSSTEEPGEAGPLDAPTP